VTFVPRWSRTVAAFGWLLWLAAALWLTWKPFLWHVEYFKKPGPHYYWLLIALLPVLAAAPAAWQRMRRRGLWRAELRLLAAFALAAGFAYEPWGLLVALWLFLASYLLGGFALEKLGLAPDSEAEHLALAAGAGLSLLICILFLLGLARLYYAVAFALLLAAPLVVFFRRLPLLGAGLRGLDRAWRNTPELAGPFFAPLTVFAAIFLLFALMVAVAPSIGIDAMRHHIPAIRYYDAVHALTPVPSDRYSYLPQNAEILMTAAYSLGGLPAAQFVNPLWFLLTLLISYRAARLCGIGAAPSAAAVIFGGTIPFLHWTGSILKNDFALAFCQMAALVCYLRARRSENPNWLLLGSLLVGISAGVKYMAVYGGIPLGLLYLSDIRRRPRRWTPLASCLAVFAVTALAWPLRNYALTGEPFYPVSAQAAVDPASEGLAASEHPPHWRLPWTIHFEGYWAFEAPTDNPMGVFWVLFWPVWLFWRRRRPSPEERACLFFALLFFLYWGYIWPIVRYALPLILLISIFTAARLWDFHESSARPLRWAIRGATVYSFLFAMLVAMTIEVNAPQLRYLAGLVDREGYLRAAVRSYPAAAYLRERAGPEDWILSCGNGGHAYLKHLGKFHIEPCSGRFRAGFEQTLAAKRWDWVILPNRERRREQDAELMRQLATEAELRYEDRFYAVYGVKGR